VKRLRALSVALVLVAGALFGWRVWVIRHMHIRPDAWVDVQARGRLLVGTDPTYMPFSGYAGDYTGLEPELMREVARRLGVEIQFLAWGGDGLYEALDVGQVDALASQVVIDPERMGQYRYSTPYFQAGQVLVVRDNADIAGPADLAGRTVAVELGSDGDALARRWAALAQAAGTGAPPAIVHTGDPPGALAAVAGGQADAAVVDHLSALEALRDITGLRIVDPPLTDESYAVVVRSDSPELMRHIQAALADMRADGTLDRLVRKWLPGW
jgi:ABC-type amino acid transport substrate-binding protein